MTSHQDIFGFIHPSSEGRRPPVIGMQFLHERAMRPRNFVARSSLLKPQDFISFILGHRTGATRPDVTRPRVSVTLNCLTPSGKAAVEISL